jgi:peptidyl-prolyl cis-trans isomerase D
VDPAVEEAAFSLDEGEAAFVDGRFGPLVVRVSEIDEAAKRPLAAVEDEIRRTLAIEEASGQVNDLYVSIEDAVAGGSRVDEIAERFDLPLRTVEAVSRRGLDRSGGDVEGLPDAVLSTAFEVAPGDDAEPVRVGDASVWVQTSDVIEAMDRPFPEVTGEVLVAWTEAQKVDRLADTAREALEAVEGGVPVADVAGRYGVEARTSEPFSRTEPAPDVPEQVLSAAFEGPEGHEGAVVVSPGRHVVFEVTSVSEPVFFEGLADLQPIRQSLNDQLASTLLFDVVNAWRAEVGATPNPTVINQIVGLDQRAR